MKRSDYLKPLSWEHHHALTYANRLKIGLQKNTAPQRMQSFIETVWAKELQPHFNKEERYFPSLSCFRTEDDTVFDTMMDQHRLISGIAKEIISSQQIDTDPIDRFREALTAHVRFEERELFPFIEKNVTADELNQLGRQLEQVYRSDCLIWQDEFWKQDKQK